MLSVEHVLALCLRVPTEAHELQIHRRALGSLLLASKEVSRLVTSEPGFAVARRAHFLAGFGIQPPFLEASPNDVWYGLEYVDGSRVYIFKNMVDGLMRNGMEEEMVEEQQELA